MKKRKETMWDPLRRESRNGYEVSIAMHHLSNCFYQWELIRYPTDINNMEETETIMIIDTKTPWDRVYKDVKAYLDSHTDDGFNY